MNFFITAHYKYVAADHNINFPFPRAANNYLTFIYGYNMYFPDWATSAAYFGFNIYGGIEYNYLSLEMPADFIYPTSIVADFSNCMESEPLAATTAKLGSDGESKFSAFITGLSFLSCLY